MGKHTQAPKLINEEYLAENFSDADTREIVLNGSEKMRRKKRT